MTDRESFIAAIATNPDDDTPRLAFADWLEEGGDGSRAGFIRDQVRLAKLRPGTEEYLELYRRTGATLRANLPGWIQSACEAFGQPAKWEPAKRPGSVFGIDVGRHQFLRHHATQGALYSLDFHRGFIDNVTLTPFDKVERAALEHLLNEQPVTRLRINLPTSLSNWERIASVQLKQIRSLAVSGSGRADVDASFFNSTVWSGVRRLTLAVQPLPALSRTSIAKQLTVLRLHHDRRIIEELAAFPLDDRIQEFAILPPFLTSLGGANSLAPFDISKLSTLPFRPTLKRLDLTGYRMGDAGLATFARGEVWIRLRSLALDRNRFGDPGWRDFVRGRRTPELRVLTASRNFITNEGAVRLADSPLVEKLEYVDLRGNRIEGKGAMALARHFADSPLKKLLLAGNPIRESDAAAVRKVLGERVDIG